MPACTSDMSGAGEVGDGSVPKLQLIDRDGTFRAEELRRFVHAAKVDSTSDYQVVAIMGPQSSGKSTLMNHVVGS